MIKVQAVQELEKCQGVLVVVQLLALARPMALQMQAAAILQASTFSPLPYCFLKRFRGFGVLTSSALCIASNVLKVLKYFDSKGNSDLLPCLIGMLPLCTQTKHGTVGKRFVGQHTCPHRLPASDGRLYT